MKILSYAYRRVGPQWGVVAITTSKPQGILLSDEVYDSREKAESRASALSGKDEAPASASLSPYNDIYSI